MQAISNTTLNRLSGFVMVVNTLLPGLVVLLISIGSAYLVPSYLQEIRDGAQKMQTAANNAKNAAGDVARNIQTHATNAQKRLEKITTPVGKTKAKLDEAKDTINEGLKKAKLPKDWRKGLNAAFAEVYAPLSPVFALSEDFKGIGAEIAKLDKLKTHFDKVATNAQKIYDNLHNLIGFLDRWWVLLGAALVIIVAWIVLSYTLWAYRRLVIGLALMRGSDPAGGSW